jgi:hypothetical protein
VGFLLNGKKTDHPDTRKLNYGRILQKKNDHILVALRIQTKTRFKTGKSAGHIITRLLNPTFC